MTETEKERKICGWQPKGKAENIPKPPKFNRDSSSEEGRVSMPIEEFDKLQKLALSAHTDKLSVEKLQERCDRYEKALTESKELSRDMNRECGGLSEPEETLYNIISQAFAAIGGKND